MRGVIYMNAKLSVVIPCFNEEKKIGKCLDGLLDQNVPPYEIIVVDGQSKDDTRKIVKEYEKRNKLIKLLVETGKRSPANARNVGWKAAKGNYILFMDADSVCDENFVDIINKSILNKKNEKPLTFYPSIVDSWKELFMKYFWYGRTMPRYLLKNRKDYKTFLRVLLSIGLIVLPFLFWNVFAFYLLLLDVFLVLSISMLNGLLCYKNSKIVSFLVTVPVNIFFIFISTGIGVISIPFLYLTGKYNIGR
jgi:glycosyltransferase involved in cell wall biosynthesis